MELLIAERVENDKENDKGCGLPLPSFMNKGSGLTYPQLRVG